MWLKSFFIVAATFVVAASIALVATAQPVAAAGQRAQVLFVCRNGVSMSVWSAAYFNRLAAERGLPQRATARATISDYTTVPLRMRFALAVDGFRLDGYRPHVVTAEDVRDAEHIVIVQGTDDTVLPFEMQAEVRQSEVWRGFSPMREHYLPARKAIREKVEDLITRLTEQDRH